MRIAWGTATVGILITAAGLAFIVARKQIARFAAYRRQKYYPTGMKQVFEIQSKPTYYLVLGIVVIVIGLFVALASLRR